MVEGGQQNRFQILSLDGGGVKGVYIAALLANLEKELNISIVDHFDLITGTSTGGIISLGLGIGMSAEEILGFYKENGEIIFPNTLVARGRHLFKSKYSSGALSDCLQKTFGDKILGDSSKRLVIPAYDLSKSSVCLFKTRHHINFIQDYKLPAWKIAMATSAAPTYFEVFTGIDNRRLIDGGVWANNPSLVGITEAKAFLGQELKNIRLLSIGTTESLIDNECNSLLNGRVMEVEGKRH